MEYSIRSSLFILMFPIIMSFDDIIQADIIRDELWFESEFSIVILGRNLNDVVMHINDVDFARCALYCIEHLKCRSVNYNEIERVCELCNNEFNEGVVDGSIEWKHYSTPPKQNGGYSKWIDGRCSTTCGIGERIRYRRCNNPTPRYGGDNCKGPYLQTVCCNNFPCPVNGAFNNWSEFGNCSKSCGIGIQMRNRTCNNPAPLYGGTDCSILGNHTEYRNCSISPCPVPETNFALKKQAIQSSTYRNHIANLATDGLMTTRALTGRDYSWWYVDLQQMINISRIVTYIDDRYIDEPNNGVPVLKMQTRKMDGDMWNMCKDIGMTRDLMPNIVYCDKETLARFVKISNMKDDHLRIWEVMVYGEVVKVNMALMKPTQQSSTYTRTTPPLTTLVASRGNDGDIKTGSVTDFETSPWWKVDMLRLVEIYHIEIILSNYALTKKEVMYKDLVINTRIVDTEPWKFCKRINEFLTTKLIFNCDTNRTARYVQVNRAGRYSKPMYLQEVEVYGNVIAIGGFWSVRFPASDGNHIYAITKEGKITVQTNNHQSFFTTSDDQVNFPSALNWFKINNVIRVQSWEYIRLKANGELEVHHFCSDGPSGNPYCNNHYKTLPFYSNAGIGRRLDGEWRIKFTRGIIRTLQITKEGKTIYNKHHSHLSLSDDQSIFPISKGWFQINNVIRQNTWYYLKLKPDDTIAVHFFCSDNAACNRKYRGMRNYYGGGVGRRG